MESCEDVELPLGESLKRVAAGTVAKMQEDCFLFSARPHAIPLLTNTPDNITDRKMPDGVKAKSEHPLQRIEIPELHAPDTGAGVFRRNPAPAPMPNRAISSIRPKVMEHPWRDCRISGGGLWFAASSVGQSPALLGRQLELADFRQGHTSSNPLDATVEHGHVLDGLRELLFALLPLLGESPLLVGKL